MSNLFELENIYGEEYRVYMNDQINDGLGPGADKKYLDFLINNLNPNINWDCAEILDVGARQFSSYDYFKDKFNLPIIGIDVCKEALDLAAKDNKPLLSLDAHVMNNHFFHNYFDLIIAFHSFEHMYDLPRVLKNSFEILKPNGYLYFALPMPCKNWKRGHWYSVPNNETMCSLLKTAGFFVEYEFLSRNQKFRPGQEMVGLCRKEVFDD